jgi:hypothetical protein
LRRNPSELLCALREPADRVDAIEDDAHASRTRLVTWQVALHGIPEPRQCEELSKRSGDVKAHFVGRSHDFVPQLNATVDHGDYVFEVAASEEVPFTAIAERFELRRDEERRCHEPDQ